MRASTVARIARGILPLALLLFLRASCSSPGSDNGQHTVAPVQASTTFNVTLQDTARTIAPETVQTKLTSVSSDFSEFQFASSATDVAALVPGDVVIFSGHSLRKITSVDNTGDRIVLQTESATLGDAIRDGEVGWAVPVDFASGPVPELSPNADPSFTFAQTSTTAKSTNASSLEAAKFTVSGRVEPWDVSLEFSPAADRLNVKITGSFTSGGKTFANVTGSGWVSNFNHIATLQYAGGQLTAMDMQNQGFSGEMNIDWAMFTEPGVKIADTLQFKLPLEIPIPINVGGIPLKLKIKCIARVVPELRTPSASSGGHFKIVYTADSGFTFANEAVKPAGQFSSGDITIPGETVTASLDVEAGVGFGVEFPRLELSLPGNVAVAFITLDNYAFSLYRPGLLSGETSCQCGGVRFKAIAGYKLDLLGKAGFADQTDLWSKDLDSCLNGVSCD